MLSFHVSLGSRCGVKAVTQCITMVLDWFTRMGGIWGDLHPTTRCQDSERPRLSDLRAPDPGGSYWACLNRVCSEAGEDSPWWQTVVGYDISNDLKVLDVSLPPEMVRDIPLHFSAERCSEPIWEVVSYLLLMMVAEYTAWTIWPCVY